MHRIIKTKMDTPLYAESEILNPNCSETVFRLTGDFKEIKKQVYNLIEWVEMEYDGRAGDGPKQKLDEQHLKMFKDLRDQVKVTTTLKEIEQIVISFTCNYETFFKEKDGDLYVATCNNYNYDNVDKNEAVDIEDDYYTIAGKTNYDVIEKYDESWILKLCYDDEGHKAFPKFIVTEPGIDLLTYGGNSAKKNETVDMIMRNGYMYHICGNKLIRIEELKDKVKLNKIKIVLSLEKAK